jgi:uncharacterized protein with HEPN domain
MSAENRIADYLEHMLESAKQACSYVDGLTKENFLEDRVR